MGYLQGIDPDGWAAVQVANFMEKVNLYSDFYQVNDLLAQLDSMHVCKGIIVQLLKENRRLQMANRRLRHGEAI